MNEKNMENCSQKAQGEDCSLTEMSNEAVLEGGLGQGKRHVSAGTGLQQARRQMPREFHDKKEPHCSRYQICAFLLNTCFGFYRLEEAAGATPRGPEKQALLVGAGPACHPFLILALLMGRV